MLPKGFASARRRLGTLAVVAAAATVVLLQVTSIIAVPFLPVIVLVYTIAELAFAWIYTAKRKYLEQLPVEQQTSVEQAWSTFNRVQETLRTLRFDGSLHHGSAWLSEWLTGDGDPSIANQQPQHDNVAELMAQAFFCSSWSVTNLSHSCMNISYEITLINGRD